MGGRGQSTQPAQQALAVRGGKCGVGISISTQLAGALNLKISLAAKSLWCDWAENAVVSLQKTQMLDVRL